MINRNSNNNPNTFFVVQPWCKKEKENCTCLIFKHLHFVGYSEDYLFSNRFMEDLGRIYRLKKVIPDPEKYAF